MTDDSVELPDFTRPDVGTILISPWEVGDRERQHSAVDSTIFEWERAPKPSAFLTLNCFTSLDGAVILNYAQWTNDEAHHEFVREHRPELVQEIDTAVPNIERPGLVRYRLYRSVGPGAEHAGRPTVISVGVHQVDSHDRARQLADALIAAYEPHDGMAACHFHVDVDGTRLLMLGEWRDERAYEAFAGSPSGDSAQGIVDDFPGAEPLENRLYRLYRKLVHRPAP